MIPGPALQSIAITPANPSTALNARLPLTATGTFLDKSTKDITTIVSWSSANAAVATVGAKTGIVAPAPGAAAGQTVVITATSGTVSASVTVTLTPIATFSLTGCTTAAVGGCEPLVFQQWGVLNSGQNGFADTAGVANTGGALGTDVNANPVYSTYGHTGYGVTVAVVDSGLEIAHEDLKPNVVPNGSWNFINNTTDPTNAIATTGDHGTMVSGLIAMAKNGIGGMGVAPGAQLKGFNFLATATTGTLANQLASLGGSAANPNSTDVAVFNQSYGTGNTADFPEDPFVEAQYASGTSTLRGGLGAVYVKSAGNGFLGDGANFAANCGPTGNSIAGISCQNANFDPDDTLPYNIVMGALNAGGVRTSYSTAGSALWASAPGGEAGFNQAALTAAGFVDNFLPDYAPAMVTTDQSGCTKGEAVTAVSGKGPFSYFNWGSSTLGGLVNPYAGLNTACNYTNGMNGTSSASPMMSGVIALMLEAKPTLTWRDVKYILAKTAVKVDAAIAPVTVTTLTGGAYTAELGWITNKAGFNFQNSYGFGAVNAGAAVAMAKTYVSALGTFANTGWLAGTVAAGGAAVPDNSITGVSVPVAVAAGAGGVNTIEAVQIQVTTTAPKATTSVSGCLNGTDGCTGDLGIELTSPSGTKSILKNIQDGFDGFNLSGMVLASNAFYGEAAAGTWTVKVLDGRVGNGIQTLTTVKLRIYGH